MSYSQSSTLINVGKKISRRQSDDYLTAEMTGFGLDPDWLTEQLRSCSAIQKPIFKYVAKNDTFLPVAFADGLEVGGTVGLPVPVGGWVGGVG